MRQTPELPAHFNPTEHEKDASKTHVIDTVLSHLLARMYTQSDIVLYPVSAGKESHPALLYGNGHIILVSAPTTPMYESASLSTLMHDIFSSYTSPGIDLHLDNPRSGGGNLRAGLARFTQGGKLIHIPQYDIAPPDDSLLQAVGFKSVDVMPILPIPRVTDENQQTVEIFFFPHPEIAAWLSTNFQQKDKLQPNQIRNDQGLVMRGIIPKRVLSEYQRGNYLANL